MRVLARPADSGACGLYRITEPARVLAGQGHDVELFDRFISSDDEPDVVVLQRPLRRHTAEEFIPALHRNGVAVVVELDDDLTALQPGTFGWRATYGVEGMGAQWLRSACRQADLVTCTTDALARRFGGHGRVAVLPNYVPARFLDIPDQEEVRAAKQTSRFSAGWAGFTSTHPGDLNVCGNGVADAIGSGPYRWRSIGDALTHQVLRIPSRHADITGPVPIADYPTTVSAQLGVGIVPLRDTAFNRAKSGLKLLEYAALGVAPVVSPTPDNQRLLATLAGHVATRPREWKRGILRAFTDHDDIVAHNRAMVRRHHTIETNAWRWAEAWATARSNFLHRKAAA